MTRDITKVFEEYDNKYEQKSRIYASEINELLERSNDTFELITNCIKFGYVVGRRAERSKRYKRSRNI